MSAKPLSEALDAQAQDPLRAIDPKVKPLTVEDALALPALNGPDVICRLWGGISRSWFHRLNNQGAFDFLKVTPAVGPCCFSGDLIGRYIRKEPLYEPTFGRKVR